MIWLLLILAGAAGWESGESVSLLSRTPKARASRQFWDCASCRFSPNVDQRPQPALSVLNHLGFSTNWQSNFLYPFYIIPSPRGFPHILSSAPFSPRGDLQFSSSRPSFEAQIRTVIGNRKSAPKILAKWKWYLSSFLWFISFCGIIKITSQLNFLAPLTRFQRNTPIP